MISLIKIGKLILEKAKDDRITIQYFKQIIFNKILISKFQIENQVN
jgi:hypothetical protein